MANIRVEINAVMVDLPQKEKIKNYKEDLLDLLNLPRTSNKGEIITEPDR